MPEEKKDREIL